MRALLVLVLACSGAGGKPASASAKGPQAANETIIDAGGALPTAFPLDPIEVKPAEVLCYGFTEGAMGTPLDSLYTTAEAQAREDFGRFIGMAVQHLDLQLQAAGQEGAKPAETDAASRKAAGITLGKPDHAWQKIERDGAPVLRVFIRYHVSRPELQSAFAAGIDTRPNKNAIVERTFTGMVKK